MRGETGGTSENRGGEWRSSIGRSDGRPRVPVYDAPIVPVRTPSERTPVYDGPRPITKGSLGSKVDLGGLAGRKLPALRISADGSRIEQFTFNGNEHWRYEALRSDRNRAILMKKDAVLDIENSLASDYLRNHSDAAKESDSLRRSLKPLRGDVIVLGYDRLWDKPTGLTEFQVTELAETLEWIDPTISVERIQEL